LSRFENKKDELDARLLSISILAMTVRHDYLF